ncbi:MAG: type IIL restriction-modification enzyme MmeI [Alphaproteobacteria bacterium]
MADAEAFIAYWSEAGGTERSNYTRFLDNLCKLIGVDVPGRSSDAARRTDYEYERQVIRHPRDGTTTPNYINLYRRGCFVLDKYYRIFIRLAARKINTK